MKEASSATEANRDGLRPGRWSAKYPHLGTGRLHPDVFVSPDQFELEREHIFKKTWLNVGRINQIPNAGD